MSALSNRLKVEIWTDPICPWCWVGLKRFNNALSEFAHKDRVIVVPSGYRIGKGRPVIPFIDHLYQGTGDKTRVHEILQRIEETGATVGLQYNFAGMKYGDTADAHALLAAANRIGIYDAVHERFFKANMVEGRSLFDRDELRALAIEAGMDDQIITTVLNSSKFAKALERDEQRAAQWGGGVPLFLFAEQEQLNGAHPEPHFSALLEKHWALMD